MTETKKQYVRVTGGGLYKNNISQELQDAIRHNVTSTLKVYGCTDTDIQVDVINEVKPVEERCPRGEYPATTDMVDRTQEWKVEIVMNCPTFWDEKYLAKYLKKGYVPSEQETVKITKMRKLHPLVYLASPHSHKDMFIRDYRHLLAVKALAIWFKEGLAVFSPIVNTYAINKSYLGDNHEYELYQSIDERFIDSCTEVRVLCVDGWKESKGVASEIGYAERKGIPVTYWLFNDQFNGMEQAKHLC